MQCGKCRISGADLEGFRSQFGHAPVTQFLSSGKLSSAWHPCGGRAGERASCPRVGSTTRELGTSLRRMCFCRICVQLASPAGVERRRRESRLIRPPTDIGAHRSPAARFFLARARLGPGAACSRILQKTGKYRSGRVNCRLDRDTKGRGLPWAPRWTSSGADGMNAPGRLYLRHEK